MLHETLGERLNQILIITNGSRNEELYRKIAEIAKHLTIRLNISIHTDHVDMAHILKLIENLSGNINMKFSLMFNPDKRDFVHEIYETLFECRKNFWFNMNVVTLRDEDRVDPRYTPEDFAWQKKAVAQFNALVKSLASQFPPRKKPAHSRTVIRDIEDNGEIKTVPSKNRTLELADGLLAFKDMYCVAHAAVLYIEPSGSCRGMVCGDDKAICNIFKKNALLNFRDNLIHYVKCTRRVCGCSANDPIPKFASEEDAKKFVEFAQKKQTALFNAAQ